MRAAAAGFVRSGAQKHLPKPERKSLLANARWPMKKETLRKHVRFETLDEPCPQPIMPENRKKWHPGNMRERDGRGRSVSGGLEPGIAQRIAEQVHGDDGEQDHHARVNREPGIREQVRLRPAEHVAPAGGRGLHAEAKE